VKLRIEQTARADGICIAVAGEVDAYTAPQMKAALLDAVSRHRSVGVDLAAVTFMDSQGLAVLLRARQETESRGGTLRLERVPTRVSKLLRITALESLFIIDSMHPAD
jgi:anti-sigma B factor antagonist